jgi:hypothetical protein
LRAKDNINNVVLAEPVEIRESAEQISNRNDMLVLYLFLTLDGLDPLIGCPSPEGSPAFCHLAK